jgi:hypothetical protein
VIEIHGLKKIRTFYPSQWEGRADTGDIVCIRYRHGELLAWIHEENNPSLTLFCEAIGERHGFEMDTEEMKAHLVEVCRFVDGGKDKRPTTK